MLGFQDIVYIVCFRDVASFLASSAFSVGYKTQPKTADDSHRYESAQ